MAFSKEKIEDERVQKIRSSALRVSLGTLLGGMIAFLFTTFISNSELSITNDSLIVFILFALGVYHLFFHISLYFDPKWAYGDNSAMENIRKNKAFFIVYTLVTVIAIGLAIFL